MNVSFSTGSRRGFVDRDESLLRGKTIMCNDAERANNDDRSDCTTQQAFALMLEMACSEFETLMALVREELFVIRTIESDQTAASRATTIIKMALAKSFLFNANRAHRICWKNKSKIQLSRKDRDDFLRATRPLTDVRDVNEHGFDGDERSEKNKPSMHSQFGGILDGTSLVIFRVDQILMGPLNLYDIYRVVARVREVAGFASLARITT